MLSASKSETSRAKGATRTYSKAVDELPRVRGGNILHEITVLPNEPKDDHVSALNTTPAVPKISTEPKEPKTMTATDPCPQLGPLGLLTRLRLLARVQNGRRGHRPRTRMSFPLLQDVEVSWSRHSYRRFSFSVARRGACPLVSKPGSVMARLLHDDV